jgi:hypothetical protein
LLISFENPALFMTVDPNIMPIGATLFVYFGIPVTRNADMVVMPSDGGDIGVIKLLPRQFVWEYAF